MAEIIGGNDNDEENMMLTTPKIIVFVAGGIGYNEVRAIRNLENIKNNNATIIIGGTSLLKPNDFFEHLQKLKNPFDV